MPLQFSLKYMLSAQSREVAILKHEAFQGGWLLRLRNRRRPSGHIIILRFFCEAVEK